MANYITAYSNEKESVNGITQFNKTLNIHYIINLPIK